MLKRLLVAARPSVLFATAFALATTPHEAAHALAAYLLGFNLTLFKMWVNPDAQSATPSQIFIIAVAGPVFSLILGGTCFLFYAVRQNNRSSGLLFLMLGIIGVYSFLGPAAAVAFGGDFNTAGRILGISRAIADIVSAVGLILLAAFMFYAGRELRSWAPPGGGRLGSVAITALGPWILGTTLMILFYWPLPRFIITSNVVGSIFWLFAVIGAAFGRTPAPKADAGQPLTIHDAITTAAAICMILSLEHGVRLAH